MVLGISTAGTMWFSTIVGLCLGGGQVVLGSTAMIIGFLVFWALRFGEQRLETYQRGALTIISNGNNVSVQSLSRLVGTEALYKVRICALRDQKSA